MGPPTFVGGDRSAGPGQQLQTQGAQLPPGGQAEQAQPQPLPALPVPWPASAGGLEVVREQTPVGHGATRQARFTAVQPHPSIVSATHDAPSV